MINSPTSNFDPSSLIYIRNSIECSCSALSAQPEPVFSVNALMTFPNAESDRLICAPAETLQLIASMFPFGKVGFSPRNDSFSQGPPLPNHTSLPFQDCLACHAFLQAISCGAWDLGEINHWHWSWPDDWMHVYTKHQLRIHWVNPSKRVSLYD